MKNCRICNYRLKKIIDFGKIALVGNFFKQKINQKKYNISLNYCINCKHVQIAERLNPNLLFKNYLWETGISSSNIQLIDGIIKKLEFFGCNNNSKIFEIACNDCSFLEAVNNKLGCKCVGIDPAKNLIKKNKSKKIYKINDYFNTKISKKIKKNFENFDFIIARNVIAHVKDPNQIFAGARNLLKNNGIFIIEFPSLLKILQKNQYDNIFHEHIGFHSLKSIDDLCKRNNLYLFDLDLIESQGGSIRCYISPNNSTVKSSKIKKFKNIEIKNNLFSNFKLINFKKKINSHRKNMINLLKKLKIKNKSISIYGASGKGQALMQYCNITNKIIDFVFDKSKLKQGTFTPGTNIQILNTKKIKKLSPDYLLLLTWNLKNEILKQEKSYIKKGGKFIIPFPKPYILKQ